MAKQTLQFDRSLLGKELPGGSTVLTRERIAQFCQFIGETDPIYLDEAEARRQGWPGQPVRPIFLALLRRREDMPDIRLEFKSSRGFLGGQNLEFFAPIYIGDTISATRYLKEVYQKTGRSGTMVFVVWQTVFTNQNGVKVGSLTDSRVLIGKSSRSL